MTQTNKFKVGDKVVDNKGTVWEVFETDNSAVPYHCKSTEGWYCWFTSSGDAYTHGYGYDRKLVGLADSSTVIQEPSVTNNKAHKHKDLIIAWANGAEIEFQSKLDGTWCIANTPDWSSSYEYRIKPEAKPDVVKYMGVEVDPLSRQHTQSGLYYDGSITEHYKNQLKLTFCAETGKLKAAEVIEQF